MARDRNRVPLGQPRQDTPAALNDLEERVERTVSKVDPIYHNGADGTGLTTAQQRLLNTRGTLTGTVTAVFAGGGVEVQLDAAYGGGIVAANDFASRTLVVNDKVSLSYLMESVTDLVVDGVRG